MIICYYNKTNFSSSTNGVIRPVLNFLFFSYNKILRKKKKRNQNIVFFRIRFHKYKKVPKSTKKNNQYIDFFQDKISQV